MNMTPPAPFRYPTLLVICSLAAWALPAAGTGDAMPGPDAASPIWSIEQVRKLTPEQADKHYAIHLRGVVTFTDWNSDAGLWGLFLQDQTAGIYIGLRSTNDVPVGEELEVDGTTAAGRFAPMVSAKKIHWLGHKSLPEPQHDSYDQLATGKENCQWVEVRGVVRSVLASTKDQTRVDLVIDGQRLSALVRRLDVTHAQKLICATVRMRGVCRARFNRKRQLRAPYLSVSSSADIVIEQPAPGNPVEVPMASLLQFNSEGYYGRRVEVQGVVTEQKGHSLFIQDHGASLYVKSQQSTTVVPGDVVKVIGFPVLGQYAPVLEDAVFQNIGHEMPPAPVDVKIEQLAAEDYDRVLVRLRGRLMNRLERVDEHVLVLEASNIILSAHLDKSTASDRVSRLQDGSQLELTGVCLAQPVENWNPSTPAPPEAFQLLLRSADDVVVLSRPSWWTLSRLCWVLGILGMVLLAGFAWVFVLDRQVRRQTDIIQQKIQREAVLEERTRIAREFHDTLEQELAAITIQLDTVSAQFDNAPGVARRLLELARTMSRRSLFEARRSVWDLRSYLLESSNLVTALSEVTTLMAASAHLQIGVRTSGQSRKLAAPVENNLLRITQEALTNALKHAHASQITVQLDYELERVCLRVRDNGVGFDTTCHATIYGGHFGLLDMSERAEKIGGAFSMISAPGQGTEIVVKVADKGAPNAAVEPEIHQEQKASAA